MTEALPENIRRAGYDALEELAARMSRASAALSKHAMRLRLDDPKSHREALKQLRRYQTFKQPCSEEVAVIEGALTGLTEPESRALSERRRMERSRQERADAKEHVKRLEESWQQGGYNRREAVQRALQRAQLLFNAASHVEKNAGYIDLAKALAACMDAWWPGGSPYDKLAWRLSEIDGQREEATNLGGNVISGPWDNAS